MDCLSEVFVVAMVNWGEVLRDFGALWPESGTCRT